MYQKGTYKCIYLYYIYISISIYIYLASTTLREKQCGYGKHFETSYDQQLKYFHMKYFHREKNTLVFHFTH